MPLDLARLTPAPWHAFYGGEPCYLSSVTGAWLADFKSSATDGANHDALFVALARNAFDVMMRRGWGVKLGADGKWYIVKGIFARGWWDDPFTALIEADRIYREMIDKGFISEEPR